MKQKVSQFCFWFHHGSKELRADDEVILEAMEPGCYYDEYGDGVKLCLDFCPQFYTFDKEIIKMLKGNDFQAAREWQRKGRKKGKEAKHDKER